MPNPFTQKEVEFDEAGDIVYSNNQSHGTDRFTETQMEWYYNQYQMRYKDSLDKSERIRIEILMALRNRGVTNDMCLDIDEFIDMHKEVFTIGTDADK